jgi:hypothetical protein
MSPNIPMKNSARSGRFKKKLVPPESLRKEAEEIESKFLPILHAHESKSISDAEFCALYILTILNYRFPHHWLGAKRSPIQSEHNLPFPISNLENLGFEFTENIQKRLSQIKTLGDIFNNYSLKSTPQAVNRALLQWSTGLYGLVLMFRIPSAAEVLNQQKHAKRCVTVLWEKKRTENYILGERDALSFTMHDLIHADHFFFHNECFEGQLGFYGLLDFCMKRGDFNELMSNDKFYGEFEYLISDMNAYAIHLMKCLKSALIFYHAEKDLFFNKWIRKLELNSAELSAIENLNSPHHKDEDHKIILELLARFKAQIWPNSFHSLKLEPS